MARTATAIAEPAGTGSGAFGRAGPLPVLGIAMVIGAFALLAMFRPPVYEAVLQEDRLVEWLTAAFFLVAAVRGGSRAVRRRRIFDGLVALFCLFVAGEEASWGQRLFGFTPPGYFLAENAQQEFNLHNFRDVFGQPKVALAIALAGYGIVLPALVSWRRSRPLLERVGATAPAPALGLCLAALVVLLWWYPFKFTGEWVELTAALTFWAATLPGRAEGAFTLVSATAGSMLLSAWSGRPRPESPLLACARAEVRAIAAAVAGSVPTIDEGASLHKRVWTAARESDIEWAPLAAQLASVPCSNGPSARERLRFAVDPWGSPYWIRVGGSPPHVEAYSFGPNRRRDEPGRGDDPVFVAAVTGQR